MITRPLTSIPGDTKVICGQPSVCRTAMQARWFCWRNLWASAISIFTPQSIAMAIGSPGSAIDPHFGQFESVSVSLFLAFECHPAPAEYGNFLGAPVLLDDNHGARKPGAGLRSFRFQLDSVASVILSWHSGCERAKVCGRLLHGQTRSSARHHQMLTLPPFSLMPSCARASTTGISAPSVLPTSAASGRSLS